MKTIATILSSLTLVALLTSCGDSASNAQSSLDDAFNKSGITVPMTVGSGVLRLRCEVRSNRSKISVDANNVAPGNYSAKVTSGSSEAISTQLSTIGDEVEFDFDSDGDDIAEGATPIAANFIQGGVMATLFNNNGDAVGSAALEACLTR